MLVRRRSLLFAAVAALAPLAAAPHHRLIVVSVDGLMPRTLANAAALGLKIPNLIEFRDGGAHAAGLRGVFPTVTYPSHTTIATGVEPAVHGIFANTIFDPELRTGGAWFAFSESIRAPTLWDVARSAGLRTAAVSWPVTVGAAIDYNIPEYYPLFTSAHLMMQRAISTPGLLSEFERAAGPIRTGGRQDDAFRARQAAFVIRAKRPGLLLVHLVDLDHEQHASGPESKEALRTLERIDECIGQLRQAVADSGAAASTRWIILSDHGFWPVSKAFHPHAFLNSLGYYPAGDPTDWRVAAHTNAGSLAFRVKDPGDREAIARVTARLKQMQAEGGWGIGRIFDAGELAAMKAYPGAFAAVSLESGFTAGPNRTGEWVTGTKTRGTHGYAPGPEDLDAAFVAWGAGIQARRLPRAELIDAAPTAAALLGLRMPSAAGRDLLSGR